MSVWKRFGSWWRRKFYCARLGKHVPPYARNVSSSYETELCRDCGTQVTYRPLIKAKR